MKNKLLDLIKRFIQDSDKNFNKGFSYVEALMAAALLSLFIMPVLAGFFNASRNQAYSKEAYEASLYANNLLVESARAQWPAADFAALLGNPDFDAEYKTDLFDYCLYIYGRTSAGLSLEYCLKTDYRIADSPQPVLTGNFPSPPDMLYISENYTVELNGDAYINVADGDITLVCVNDSGVPASVNIYTPDPDKITLECLPNTAGITVFFHKPLLRERIVMAEVYNKSGALLNRLAVPVFF